MARDEKHTSRGAAQDRKRVAGKQYYEVNYIARKLGVAPSKVEEAIQAVGNDRRKIEEYLQDSSRGNRR
ncbi:MAG: hypothetical protein K0R82_2275 [Flavipsychrobacter sp.]|jgi:hypothetical protein|nr:hypothetical protein [Flavipsychrobacter sp.]